MSPQTPSTHVNAEDSDEQIDKSTTARTKTIGDNDYQVVEVVKENTIDTEKKPFMSLSGMFHSKKDKEG